MPDAAITGTARLAEARHGRLDGETTIEVPAVTDPARQDRNVLAMWKDDPRIALIAERSPS